MDSEIYRFPQNFKAIPILEKRQQVLSADGKLRAIQMPQNNII